MACYLAVNVRKKGEKIRKVSLVFLFYLGCRFTETIDRGYVILDIHYTYPEDSGDYFCIARNNAGETQSNIVQLK